MPRRHRIGDQWRSCDICGILTPLGRLRLDDGIVVCDRSMCDDNPDNEYHLRGVARVMAAPTREGEDRRSDLYFGVQTLDGDN